tara:strand:+ start:1050 stop:1652 length:603 start_codon:yes stop_codon:yes gene_type:complete
MPSILQTDTLKDGSASKTLAEYSSGNWSWGSAPAGTIVYITHDEQDAYGSVGDNTTWYPTSASDMDTKTLYLNITASQHAPYSKLKIEFTMDMEVRVAEHSFCDYRLVRYQQTDAPDADSGTSVKSLIVGSRGSAGTGTDNQTHGCVSGSAIDDISSLTGDIKYAIQSRNASGTGIYAGNIYHGRDPNIQKHQMIIYGIY